MAASAPSAAHRLTATIQARVITVLALGLIFSVGAAFRFVGLDWGESQMLHPDERFLTFVASSIRPAESLAEYFDTARSPLNPNNMGYAFYVYGNFPMTLLRYVAEGVGQTQFYTIFMVGRALAAACDLLVIGLVYLIGRRLFDWRIGLLGAALYACAALPIQLSHFYTVDPFLNLFLTAAFYFAVRVLGDDASWLWADAIGFGLMLGLAMASKVSAAPMALIFGLALIIRVVKELDTHSPEPDDAAQPETDSRLLGLLLSAGLFLAAAGLVTVVTFRVAMPYAFLPPLSGEPLSEELSTGMHVLSLLGDPVGLRPNPEWLRQMSDIRFQVSGFADMPPNHQWAHRAPVLFPLGNILRVGLGWPLGLMAWFGFAWAGWELLRARQRALHLLLPVTWVGLYFLWQGTAWVKTMRYFLPIYPLLALLAAWAIFTAWDRIADLTQRRGAGGMHWSRLVVLGASSLVLLSALGWAWAVTRIYTRPITRLEASRWLLENAPSDVTVEVRTEDGLRRHQAGLWDTWSPPDAPPENDPVQPAERYSILYPNLEELVEFRLDYSGTLERVRLNHVLDWEGRAENAGIRVTLYDDPYRQNPITEGYIISSFDQRDETGRRGIAYEVRLARIELMADKPYYLGLAAEGEGPLVLAGSRLAPEDDWDEALPLPIADYNTWDALYRSYTLFVTHNDDEIKRQRLQHILDNADYIVISSNRFYDSLSRNPRRWPMTMAYYQALFDGRLGYDLVADFTSRPNIGPLTFVDDTAEEAWTVYDHPRVLIFEKSAFYDSNAVAEVLHSVDLNEVEWTVAREAQGGVLRLDLPDGPGTGSFVLPEGRVSVEQGLGNLYLRVQPLAVIVWWLAVAVIGWAAFPLLFRLMPGLADRGYAVSRLAGLLLIASGAWVLASLRWLPWGAASVLLMLVLLAVGSYGLISGRVGDLRAWLGENRNYIIWVEGLLLTAFLLFLVIRWGNPDLWHPAYGGEKPMDFAYFNAVLNSRFFPPYDPWFAGGEINYYYFGFVLVGAPVKLLGMPSSLAYNLILPLLFALTVGGVFSIVYNALQAAASRGELLNAPAELWASLAGVMTVMLGNLSQVRTYLWGLSEVAMGATTWDFKLLPDLSLAAEGFRRVRQEDASLLMNTGEWYWNATRMIPVPIGVDGNPAEVQPITEFPFFTFVYADLHAHLIAFPLGLFVLTWCLAWLLRPHEETSQVGRLGLLALGGLPIGLLIATNTWDFPLYFLLACAVIVFGHLAAHKAEYAARAFALGAIGAVLFGGGAYLALISGDGASAATSGRAYLAGAGVVGLVALLIIYGAGLVFYAQRAELAQALRSGWLKLGGAALQVMFFCFIVGSAALPYLLHYEAGYSGFTPWRGSQTPLWAYLVMYGLFVFILLSWLLTEIVTWYQAERTRITEAGRPASTQLGILLGCAALLTLIVAWLLPPSAGAALPLAVMALLVFMKPDQGVEKRLVCLLIMAGCVASVGVELATLQGDIGRMNTVFKFYLQVWMLFGVAAGAALAWLMPYVRAGHLAWAVPWRAGLAALFILAGLYPFSAAAAKIVDRWNADAPNTLDGMAYMPYVQRSEEGTSFSLAADHRMLNWLRTRVTGQPVVLEAHTTEYRWGSRVSIYTGLPTVIGWNWHQRQQRPDQADEVFRRVADVQVLYTSPDPQIKLQLLRRYGVNLIVVGDLERAMYGTQGPDVFRLMAEQGLLRIVYDQDGTVIYEVGGAADARVS